MEREYTRGWGGPCLLQGVSHLRAYATLVRVLIPPSNVCPPVPPLHMQSLSIISCLCLGAYFLNRPPPGVLLLVCVCLLVYICLLVCICLVVCIYLLGVYPPPRAYPPRRVYSLPCVYQPPYIDSPPRIHSPPCVYRAGMCAYCMYKGTSQISTDQIERLGNERKASTPLCIPLLLM